MEYPLGFEELVERVKEVKVNKLKGKDIWYKYCKIALIGKGRYDAETSFLLNMLKDFFEFESVLDKTGEEWRDGLRDFLEGRLEKIRDQDIQEFISDLLDNLFGFSATVRGGARFFEKKDLFDKIDDLTKNKEKSWELVEDIVEDKDVPGISYAKAILWLHSIGRGVNLAPPTAQLKKFLNNDIGPYHQYYRDDEHFMNRAEEINEDFEDTEMIYIYRAIHFYKTLKIFLPRGCGFDPEDLLGFLDDQDMNIEDLEEKINDINKQEELKSKLYSFMGYSY